MSLINGEKSTCSLSDKLSSWVNITTNWWGVAKITRLNLITEKQMNYKLEYHEQYKSRRQWTKREKGVSIRLLDFSQ